MEFKKAYQKEHLEKDAICWHKMSNISIDMYTKKKTIKEQHKESSTNKFKNFSLEDLVPKKIIKKNTGKLGDFCWLSHN